MLNTFLNRKAIFEVERVCEELSSLKGRIAAHDFDDSFREYQCVEPYFEVIKNRALASGDEDLANAQLVFKRYFLLFCNLSKYHGLLLKDSFRQSWNALQDCLDAARFVGRFTPIDHRLDVPDVVGLLEDYERLYPYVYFLSPEFVISESHCSICGESMQSLSCPHRRGQIYRGEISVEIVDKMRLQAVSVVENPENKRCVIESVDDEPLQFCVLKEFLELGFPWLQRFSIEKRILHRENLETEEYAGDGSSACETGFARENNRSNILDYLSYTVIPGKRIELTSF